MSGPYYVITAYVAPCDCQAVAVALSTSAALNKWEYWITRGEDLQNLPADERRWIDEARSDMRNHGRTKPQVHNLPGCHYRLEICY